MINTNIQAQAEILSMLILNNDLFKISILKEEHFTKEFAEIFKVMKQCYKENNCIVTEYMFQKLKNVELFTQIIGIYVTSDESYYKRLESFVIQAYKNRITKETCIKFVNDTIDYDSFQNELIEIDKNKTSTLKKLDNETLLKTLNNQEKKLKLYFYPKIASTLKPCQHDFIVIGACTGGGKTAFALNLLNDLSRNYPCLYVNLEVAEEQIHNRMLAINSSIEIDKIERYSTQTQDIKDKVNASINELTSREIAVITQSISLDSLKHTISSLDRQKHTIVFIDHMLLINTSKSIGRYEKVTEIAIKLRQYSLDFNITIIALCQLNRETFYNENKKPKLSSLKESGEIENSASKVLFLYYDENSNYKLSIAKNRSGNIGEFYLNYNKPTQQIKEAK